MRMLKLLLMTAIIVLLGVVSGTFAIAAPVMWVLEDASFEDEAQLSGHFVYDSTLGVLREWQIVAEAGSIPMFLFSSTTPPPGVEIVSVTGIVSQSETDVLLNYQYKIGNTFKGERNLYMILTEPMTDAGGVIDISSWDSMEWSQEWTYDNDSGNWVQSYWGERFLASGLITTEIAPVPIPGAVWLFGSGLIGIVGIRRKFKK